MRLLAQVLRSGKYAIVLYKNVARFSLALIYFLLAWGNWGMVNVEPWIGWEREGVRVFGKRNVNVWHKLREFILALA